jgi:Arc/MetJ-type ribon-helix-helix transcriptional regulator
MNITLRPETLKRINEKVRRGDFESEQAVIEQALAFFLEFETEEMDQEEFLQTKDAIEEAQGQAQRGEGVSLEEFDQNMRHKHGIQR